MADVVYDIYLAFNSSGGLAAWVGVGLTMWIAYIAMRWRNEARTRTASEVATRCLLAVLEMSAYVKAQTIRYVDRRKQGVPVGLAIGLWDWGELKPKKEALTRSIREAKAHLPEVVDNLKEFDAMVDEFRRAQGKRGFDEETKVPEFDEIVSALEDSLHRVARLEE